MPRCSSSTMPAQFSLKQFSTDRKRRPDHRACEFSRNQSSGSSSSKIDLAERHQDRFVWDNQGFSTHPKRLVERFKKFTTTHSKTARSDSYLDWNVLHACRMAITAPVRVAFRRGAVQVE